MQTTLADDLLLLAYDDAGAKSGQTQPVDYGLAGALLAELVLAGRVEVADQRLVVTDPAPTGEPVLDEVLARLAAEGKARKPKDWVPRLAKGLRSRLLDRLVEAGVLERREDTVLRVFSRTRYRSGTGAEPATETATRQRLAAAVDGVEPVDPRTRSLCALVRVSRLDGVVFPGRPRKELRARLDAVAGPQWPADAVRAAVEDAEGAVAVIVGA